MHGHLRKSAAESDAKSAAKSDAGFTLIETLVAISLIAVAMAALTTFFIKSMSVTHRQSNRQVAIQLAGDGIDRARAVKGTTVIAGRDRVSSEQQWTTPVAGVAPYLTDMTKVWDIEAAFPDGATATLPTAATPVTVNGTTYHRSWYVGSCWQRPGGGACAPVAVSGYSPFFRIVVAVTWADHACPASTCSFVTATLISSAANEPVFSLVPGVEPPKVNSPGPQTDTQGIVVTLKITSNGGLSPLLRSATGLPPGLSMDSSGTVTGIPTAPGSYPVTVRVADSANAVATATFTWTITPPLGFAPPGAQNGQVGVAVNPVQLTATGGLGPYTWSAVGLPPGLSVDASGRIAGTPTTVGTWSVSVTVTDGHPTAKSAGFTWRIQ